MRRKKESLFLNHAPENVLITPEISLNTSEGQESLRNFGQGKVCWIPVVVWEPQLKSTFSFLP